ncbi:MAG: S1 RNA-binding domain-containing protein [Candidatus Pacearchaeota archaeon]
MKKEFPEVNEVVLGVVDRIVTTSVFVKLLDYPYEGVIIFSEIAPGRIRNVRDYVNPGQKIAVKVLRVDKEKKHIDLSLRRVSSKEKKQALESEKKEREMRFLLDLIIGDKGRIEKVMASIKGIGISAFFDEMLKRENNALSVLKQAGLNEKEAQEFIKKVKEKIKTKKVQVRTEFILKCMEPDGIERIRRVLNLREARINYSGAPHYSITVESSDYKDANKKIETFLKEIGDKAKEESCEFSVLKSAK